jgi:glyoxylase-like metal-dependent hydrolase (beta-lactamase superfamily II)
MTFGLRVEQQPKVDQFYSANQTLSLGQYAVSVHHTPGHCPGGVCLALNGQAAVNGPTTVPSLFVGDTLFAGSIGRTDLPGGDMETLLRSIRDVLFEFPDEAPVYSGHGEPTTIGREKRTNPFLRP